MSEVDIERKVSVIFATDVVSYSLAMEAAEARTVKNLRKCWDILDNLFDRHGGKIFNTGGDSVLAEFKSAVSAVECAVRFQEAIQNRNQEVSDDEQLIFRIGINMGDVIEEGGNLLGEGVNIAARLEAFAQPGGVCISQPIFDLVATRTEFNFIELGQQKIKNTVLNAIDVDIPSARPRNKKISSPASRKKSYILFGFASLISIILATSTFFFFQEKQSFKGAESLSTIDHFVSLMMVEKYEQARQLANDLSNQKGIRPTAQAEAINLIALTYYAQNNLDEALATFNQQDKLESRVSVRSLRALWRSNLNGTKVDELLENLGKLGLK